MQGPCLCVGLEFFSLNPLPRPRSRCWCTAGEPWVWDSSIGYPLYMYHLSIGVVGTPEHVYQPTYKRTRRHWLIDWRDRVLLAVQLLNQATSKTASVIGFCYGNVHMQCGMLAMWDWQPWIETGVWEHCLHCSLCSCVPVCPHWAASAVWLHSLQYSLVCVLLSCLPQICA